MRFKMTRPISIAIGESLQVEIADLSKFVDLVCSIAVHTMSVKKKQKNLLSAKTPVQNIVCVGPCAMQLVLIGSKLFFSDLAGIGIVQRVLGR